MAFTYLQKNTSKGGTPFLVKRKIQKNLNLKERTAKNLWF